MAHELSFDVNGQAEAFFALQPAWHGLGKVLDHAPNSEEAIRQAGLDWRVSMRPIQTADGLEISGHFATVRDDCSRVLGVVSDRYNVVQNRDGFRFLDSLMQEGELTYESAGALRGGRQVWLLARLPSIDYIAEGDASRRYILFSTSHDGTAALMAMPTSVRVVCANTLRLATSQAVGIRHTGNVRDKLERAREFLKSLDSKFSQFAEQARKLAEKQVDRPHAEDFIAQLFPVPKDNFGRSRTMRDKKIMQLRQNYRNDRQMLPSIRGTYWALYNSVSEYVDHQASVRGNGRMQAENRMSSAIDGQGAALKTKAFDLAYQMASAV